MIKSDVIAHFGDLKNIANALGISVSAVSQWGDIIPEKNAYRLQDITDRKLKVDRSFYQKSQS